MKFKLRRYYLYYLGRAGASLLYLMPLRVSLILSEVIGYLAFWILAKYRRIAVENLRKAFRGEKTAGEIKDIAVSSFINLGKNAVELINFPKITSTNIDRLVTVRNISYVDDALRKGKGAIVLTGHFGDWELLAATFKVKNYPGMVVGRRIYFHKYDEYLNKLRKLCNVNVIYRDQSAKNILKLLRNNEIIGMLADQDVDSVDGVFVNFFGHPAYTPIAPVALAKASGAELIPAFIVREKARHTLYIEKPIELRDTGDKEKDMIANTQAWSDVIESYIRKFPDHWVWMHRRWKTKKS